MHHAFGRSGGAAAAALAALLLAGGEEAARAQEAAGPAAWRVECTGDGKTLDCRAAQQIFQRDNRQQLVPVVTMLVRYSPETKGPTAQVQVPLGLNLTEPVLFKVDNGPTERQAIQTCGNGGCLINMNITSALLTAMRNGTDLKITVQDATKKPVELALPLLGFGIAYDKAAK